MGTYDDTIRCSFSQKEIVVQDDNCGLQEYGAFCLRIDVAWMPLNRVVQEEDDKCALLKYQYGASTL